MEFKFVTPLFSKQGTKGWLLLTYTPILGIQNWNFGNEIISIALSHVTHPWAISSLYPSRVKWNFTDYPIKPTLHEQIVYCKYFKHWTVFHLKCSSYVGEGVAKLEIMCFRQFIGVQPINQIVNYRMMDVRRSNSQILFLARTGSAGVTFVCGTGTESGHVSRQLPFVKCHVVHHLADDLIYYLLDSFQVTPIYKPNKQVITGSRAHCWRTQHKTNWLTLCQLFQNPDPISNGGDCTFGSKL